MSNNLRFSMFGNDRVPQFSGSGASRNTNLKFGAVRGNHFQLSYGPNYRNTISARVEFFDPGTKKDDNIFAYGAACSQGTDRLASLRFAGRCRVRAAG